MSRTSLSYNIVLSTKLDIVAVFGNVVAETGSSVEATFVFVERIVRLVAFDSVASTLLLVWTGLK